MKKVRFALITEKHFWIDGYGANMRIQALVNYLENRTRLFIHVLDTPDSNSVRAFNIKHPNVSLEHFTEGGGITRNNCHDAIGKWLLDKQIETVIVEHLWNHWVADIAPDSTLKILDSHDIISHQIASFRRYGRTHPLNLSIEKEFDIFRKFDKVIFIQQLEYTEGCRRLGAGKCLLCPHPVEVHQAPGVRSNANTVGFLSSSWQPNIDGLIWLSRCVAPLLGSTDIRFEVYGTICNVKDLHKYCQNMIFKGPVDDLKEFYDTVDIIVNPCQYGSGLKIKSVEALAYGKPLVSTSTGGQGLEAVAGRAFLQADSPEDFAAGIIRLMESSALRHDLGTAAQIYIKNQLTPEICFHGLVADIQTAGTQIPAPADKPMG